MSWYRLLFFMVVVLGTSWVRGNVAPPYPVTIKAQEVNVRVGPGSRYPLAWTFMRPGLPLIVLAEVGTWRKIRDNEGAEGWVHQNMLTGRRGVVVRGETQSLLAKPDARSEVVAFLDAGVCVRLLETKSAWVRVKVERLEGWLPRAQTWGILEEEQEGRF
jgi:SH3-like domain-containing protein